MLRKFKLALIIVYFETDFTEQEEMEAMTKTYNQVVMDVNRSSSRFPPGELRQMT